MSIQVICLLFLMNTTNFEGIIPPQNKVDSITLLKKAYNEKDYETFFYLFPNSFSEFIEYYGYIENKPMPLYSISFEHIRYLASNKNNEHRLINKLFRIAKDAKWDADAPSYLRKVLTQLILAYPEDILYLLKKEDIKTVENFWYFILYYPSLGAEYDIEHQNLYKQVYIYMDSRDKKIGEILKNTYDKIIIESRK